MKLPENWKQILVGLCLTVITAIAAPYALDRLPGSAACREADRVLERSYYGCLSSAEGEFDDAFVEVAFPDCHCGECSGLGWSTRGGLFKVSLKIKGAKANGRYEFVLAQDAEGSIEQVRTPDGRLVGGLVTNTRTDGTMELLQSKLELFKGSLKDRSDGPDFCRRYARARQNQERGAVLTHGVH